LEEFFETDFGNAEGIFYVTDKIFCNLRCYLGGQMMGLGARREMGWLGGNGKVLTEVMEVKWKKKK